MAVYWAYLCFIPVAALCFALLPLRTAILSVLIGGWWALPVTHYGPAALTMPSPWWVVGIALPSDMLITKAWMPPLAASVGAAWRAPQQLRDWRPKLIDLPMGGWCLWPLIQGLTAEANPAGWMATLYLVGAWGLPWLIGRAWLSEGEGRLELLRAVALSGLANLPIAIIEGPQPAMLYRLVYGPHPFMTDGIERYVGYRPLGFFEDGNLYGLWAALAAFAAIAMLREKPGRAWVVLAVLDVAIALASQSAGAIALLGLGIALLIAARSRLFLPGLAAAAGMLLLIAAIHSSGIVPIQALGRSAAGQHLIGFMRSLGRGSFLWRVSQDSKTLATIATHPILGTGQWDWFRPYGTRPWGQGLLLLGQYGLVGLLLAWSALVGACAAAFRRLRGDRGHLDPSLILAIMVLLALSDALLNAFFFYPAILAAGAIASGSDASQRWRRA